MYDLPEVRPATTALLRSVASGLTASGWPVHPRTAPFADHGALIAHWLDPSTALSQACGLPYLEVLAGCVTVVGTFGWTDVVDERGRYRSLIVVRDDGRRWPTDDGRRWPTGGAGSPVRPAVNDPGSLSGWCSLGVALADLGLDASDVGPMIASGAHVASLELVRGGRADVASIDAVTYRLLERHRPAALTGLRVIGRGPAVAATPLVTRTDPAIDVEDLRRCVRRALKHEACGAAGAVLGIDGLVELHHDDYVAVGDLVTAAEQVLPRAEVRRGSPTGDLRSSPAGR